MILAVGPKMYLAEKSEERVGARLPDSRPLTRPSASTQRLAPWPLPSVQDDKPSAHGDLLRLEGTA